MRYRDLVEVYERLESTRQHSDVRKLLTDLLRPAPAKLLPSILYLSQGLLRPEFEGIELGVGEALARKAVAQSAGVDDREVRRETTASGDLGITAERLRSGQRRLDPLEPLQIEEVYAELLAIAASRGTGAQEERLRRLTGLLVRAEPVEARYLIRFVLGSLRIGIREMTLIDALAQAFADGSKAARARIERAFNLCSDLGWIAQELSRHGLEAMDAVTIQVGRPIRPMLAERARSLPEALNRMHGAAALEYKYDGLRVQAHVARDGTVRLFSRRLERIDAQFPDLVAALPVAVRRRPAVLEGECVPVDPDTDEIRPFQEISRRRGRIYELDRLQSEVPVCLFLFDLLLDGTDPTLDRPFPERRARLEALVNRGPSVRLAQQRRVEALEPAQEFFDLALSEGAEGVMVKSLAPESLYRAGARGFWWIKYKREYTEGLSDSLDGVVVGAFHGRGRRAGRFGAFLLASYNRDRDAFESFCKVGTGFDDAALAEMPRRLAPWASDDRPPMVDTGLAPDRWFRPGLVLEVRGAELTLSPIHRADFGAIRPGSGFALRFPRFTGRFRDEKAPTDATLSQELRRMYRQQVRQSPAGADPP
ncbi:MAG: ATP-dependent DNA ligase [Thermoplasmata archaeon]